MSSDYFKRLHAETATRFWVNNPSAEELEKAIAAGAICCTTNPAYCSKLLASDPAALRNVIDAVLHEGILEEEHAAALVYQRVSRRIMDRFLPIYEQSGGKAGFVTMQDDPRLDRDTAATMRNVEANRKLGPNYMAKIPVIAGGIEAIDACVEENVPICATEIFSLAQAALISEVYEKAAKRCGNRPPIFITHISGIFDQYLGRVARREGIAIDERVLDQAGCAIARKEYRLLQEGSLHGTLLGGGARGIHHFTEMVGGEAHVTINWSTADEIIQSGMAIQSRMDAQPDQAVIDELREKFVDFRKAYDDDGLSLEEFAEFGPVKFFRNAFLNGWYQLLAEIPARRNLYAL